MMLKSNRLDRLLFFVATALLVYMPLHVFIAQSASLLTGGIEIWKAFKDVFVFLLIPILAYIVYRQKYYLDNMFKRLLVVGLIYCLLHGLFLLFDTNDDLYSAVVATVYNTRLLAYLLLGYIVGATAKGRSYMRWLLTASVLIASLVALFGIMQYFLPADLLTHVGYSIDRGVKPLFFIDDKPDLPRVMSTLKDPNSFGAYLIVPILISGYALVKTEVNKKLFVKPFRKSVLGLMLFMQLAALFLTFSRGALLGLILSTVTIVGIVTGGRILRLVKRFWWLGLASVVLVGLGGYVARDSYLVQNVIFHADESTVLEDPNELRVSLTQQAVEDITRQPLGEGPGTAGLVSITNPKEGILTENYYLQIAYEVGWLGAVVFVLLLATILMRFINIIRHKSTDPQSYHVAVLLLASAVAYLFYALLIHLWSNEAIALHWWLLSGVLLGFSTHTSENKQNQ